MGLTVVPIDDRTEVHIKDNVYGPGGWQLWLSLWRDGDIVATVDDVPNESFEVPDLDDATLESAGRRFAAAVEADDQE